jgi:hypothetical protein
MIIDTLILFAILNFWLAFTEERNPMPFIAAGRKGRRRG